MPTRAPGLPPHGSVWIVCARIDAWVRQQPELEEPRVVRPVGA